MKKQKNKGIILMWIACVLSFLAVATNLFAILVISFDLWGLVGTVEKTLNGFGYTLGTDLSFVCVELAIVILIDIYAGFRYLKIARNRMNLARVGSTLVWQTVLQMFFGSFLSGLFACIGINTLIRKKPTPVTEEEKVAYINDFKKRAMGEAISRLKELKSQGAISDEEYYETLNKILEG